MLASCEVLYFCLGEERTAKVMPSLKLVNFVVLLLLNYSNAATSLPQAFAKPDWDYLIFIFFTTLFLCATAFGAGWLIARVLKADKGEQAALMFGLGMNNNGTGLVQQVIAALIDLRVFKSEH